MGCKELKLTFSQNLWIYHTLTLNVSIKFLIIFGEQIILEFYTLQNYLAFGVIHFNIVHVIFSLTTYNFTLDFRKAVLNEEMDSTKNSHFQNGHDNDDKILYIIWKTCHVSGPFTTHPKRYHSSS